jgi:hypothetical protein
MRVLESRTLTVLTTDKCTATCAHCSMNSSPHRQAKLSADQICRYVDEALDSTAIRLVIFAGGEPLLLGDDLYRSLEHVRACGLKSRVITNAYWAISPGTASLVLNKLYSSGLDELNISIDDFHLPFINPKRVKIAFDVARQLDFEAIILVHCSGPNTSFNDAELDALIGERLPRMFDEKREAIAFPRPLPRPFLAVSNATLQALGRGSELDVGESAAVEEWPEKARGIGGCPWAVRSPAISPSGHLVACCGFEVAGNPILDIGDLNSRPLADLLDQADNDLPLNVIALEGPYAIMDHLKVENPNLPFRPSYRSFCELCQDLVTVPELRDAFIRLLPSRAPAILARRQMLQTQTANRVAAEGAHSL